MITNNMVQMLKLPMINYPTGKLKMYNGETQYWSNQNMSSCFSTDLTINNYSDSDGLSMLIGSGNSAPANNQYRLDNIINTYSVIAQNHTFFNEVVFDNRLILVNRTIQNTSDNNIVIAETGLFGMGLMIAREVLPEPVTLRPREKRTFTMIISLG